MEVTAGRQRPEDIYLFEAIQFTSQRHFNLGVITIFYFQRDGGEDC